MKLSTKFKALVLVAGMVASTALPSIAGERPGEGVTVRPIQSNLLEEDFQHRILYRGLEKLGYKIATPEEVVAQTAHLAVGTGDGDFFAAHWNSLHDKFFEESGGTAQMSKVGNLISGALQGYLVDKASYDAGIKKISDLTKPENAKRFDTDGDGKADLAGCVPGWGCELVIEHQLTEYKLRDTVNHNQGEYNAIIADTIARQQNGESVLYYTWTPYWVSGVMVPGKNVEWLEVPYTSLPNGQSGNTEFNGKNLGFNVEAIRVIARNDFLKSNPAAAKFLEVAVIDINDISAQNQKMRDGEDSSDDIDRHVADWIEANQSTFDGWVKAAKGAAK